MIKKIFALVSGISIFAGLGGLAARLAIPGAGAVLDMLGALASWFFRSVLAGFREAFANKHVWLIVSLFAVGAHYWGYERGFASGAGNLETYKKSAEVLADAATADADKATLAGTKAEDAEARSIAAERKIKAIEVAAAAKTKSEALSGGEPKRVYVKTCPKSADVDKSWWAELGK